MASDIKIEREIEKVLQDLKTDKLKEEQREITVAALKKKDCMAILTTGYGKSLPYQMVLTLRREQNIPGPDLTNVGKIIVCSPIIALVQDQVDRLNSIPNVKAVYKGRCYFVCNAGRRAEGRLDYLIASPDEVLVGSSVFRQILKGFKADSIVVDECHTMYPW